MRPGTCHMVLTVEDSFLSGGHFYSRVTFSRTLTALVYEHYFGPWITNAGHLTSGSVLFRLVASYRRMVVQGVQQYGVFSLSPYDNFPATCC